uniref:hypothetical protein n=1 Tax=Massilia sp. TSP1-1-2 TaxID=2804649 RepID=UPI003CE895F0
KSVDEIIANTVYDGKPYDLFAYDGGWVLSTSTGTWRINDKWQGETLLRNRADKLDANVGNNYAVLPDGRLISVVYDGRGMMQMTPHGYDVPARQAKLAGVIDKASAWMQSQELGTNDTLTQAHQLMGLGEAARFYSRDAARRAAIEAKMNSIAATLRGRQLADGSWGA